MGSDHNGSSFVQHIPCTTCGSSDANSEYTDGHTYCFACSALTTQGGGQQAPRRKKMAKGLIEPGEFRPLLLRKITEETCKKFGYTFSEYKDEPVQVAPYYDKDGALVGQKVRFKDKTFKVFGSLDEALPFGAHAFDKTGKSIVVTEGEIDALSMSQVQGNKWPVVSIPNGADAHEDKNGKKLPCNKTRRFFAKHLDYFRGFERIVLMFDSDPQGRASAQAAAEVIGSRAHIAELPLKDPNEMLIAGRTEELINAMWRAKQYRPEGIVELSSLKERVKEAPKEGLSWWSPKLTALTYGIRPGEIHCFGAGTGVGKTDFFTQQMSHLIAQGEAIGVFSLEQAVVETAKRIAGKVAQKTFHVPGGWTTDDLDAAWAKLEGKRVFLYDSFGVNEWDSIREKIEYLHHAEGVRFFFVDHLTALIQDSAREKEELEAIMSQMGSLVAKLQSTIFLISHLSTPEGKPHEEGGRVTIRNFKGSRSIGFWSHFMYGLERNQQADDESERTTTTFRVLKDRYTGRATGQVFHLGYDAETGTLFETVPPDQAEKHGFKPEVEQATGPSDF